MKFTGRITLTNVTDGKDAVSYDIEFRLARGEDSQALSALNLSATDLKDASVQALFYRNGEAYDAPRARMWTVGRDGAVLGIPAELSGTPGAVADAGLLYVGEETAYVICRMLDAGGNALCERSLPILLNGEDGKPVTVTGDVAQYAQTETSAQPDDSAFADAMPEPAQGMFMWTKRTVTYSDGKESKSYSVSRIGSDGEGGSTTHFAYAASADGSQGFSTTAFDGATHIGSYVDQKLADSTNYKDYTWMRWRGAKGDNGTSVAITGTETVYQAWASGTETPSGAWLASVPALTDAKPFLWTRSTVTYSDGTKAVSYSVSYKGADGRSVSSIKEQYYLSTSSSELAGGSWADAPQPWEDGKFFWTRSVIAYSDGASAPTSPVCVSGGQGASGNDGRGVASVDVEYYQSGSPTELAGGSWQTDAPAWASGKYVWQRTKTTYTDGSSAYTEPACLTGEKGSDGQKGAKGDKGDSVKGDKGDSVTITDKSVKYAASASGTSVPGDGEWQTGIPALTDARPFMWTRVIITYNGANGSTTSYSVAYKGRNGADGKSVTITGKSVLYAISSSGTAAPSTGWQAGVPEAAKDKPFVWTRTTVSYSDGTTTVAYSVGRIGSDGKGISATKTMFGASGSPETQPASWSETEPELGEGEYLWTKEVTTYTDGTASEAVPAVSLDYLSRVIRKGKSALMGGLVLGNILAAADASGDVRSFLSGLLNLPALGLGVKDFGLDTYKAVTELNHDGSGHVGRFRFETRKSSSGEDEASTSVGFEDPDGEMRIVMTSDAVPTLSEMNSATQSDSASYSGILPGGGIKQIETTPVVPTGSLTVENDGSRLTISYNITSALIFANETKFVSYKLVLYRNGEAYAPLTGGVLQLGGNVPAESGNGILQNVRAGTYDVRLSAISMKGSPIRGDIEFGGDLSVYFDGTEQKVVIGRDGLMAYHSPTSYVELRRNASGQPLNVSGVQIGAGWGFGVLWMGYVDEDAIMGLSTGPLRAKGKGTVTKSGSDYTVSFPGGSSTVGTDYAVFCQPEKPSNDGRYVTVYGKTASSFHVASRWGDSQRDASFSFMIISMKGWH